MKNLTDYYELSNGVKIPCIGFGTWLLSNGETAETAVLEALKAGFRHIDTAARYNNEESIGSAIRKSGIPRDNIFVTSKLWNDDHGYETTKKAFANTMKNLDMDYLDLYLIHWPIPKIYKNENWQERMQESWRAIEEFYKQGMIKSIGVSNYMSHHIELLMETAEIKPMVNQIHLCPGETKPETSKYCKENGILLEAYSPLGAGNIFDDPKMKDMAEKYGKTISQVGLRWSLQMGFLPLTRSKNPSHIKENTELFDFEISYDDMEIIKGLKNCHAKINHPDDAPF